MPVKFLLIGRPNRDVNELHELEIEVTGEYNRADVLRLISEVGPHVIWYPTQVPETYSYTLSEGLAAGFPLVVPTSAPSPNGLVAVPGRG